MKSIMEEASSIIKAIEKAWSQAGQPKEFSVKIFEEPQKNFIGITTHSAKIGLFFNEQIQKTTETTVKARPKKVYQTMQEPAQATILPEYKRPQSYQQKKQENVTQELPQVTEQVDQQKPVVWADTMVEDIKQWLSKALNLIGKSIPFTIETNYFHLKIVFEQPLFAEKSQEKQFFASIATLYLQMLKQKYRRPLKGYKIILIGG